MHRPILAPSILSADLARLGDDVAAVLAAGADWVHFDVMDNHYVPNLTFGPMLCRALRSFGITAPLDVHLMVTPVDPLVPEFIAAGASTISFHPDASIHVDRTLSLIRDSGAGAGLAFNPAAPLDCLRWVHAKVDLVLLMSVNPGFGGQAFIPEMLEKVRSARRLLDELGSTARLEVDGGIRADNVGALAQAGADTFVAGSAIFGADDRGAAIAAFRSAIAAAGRP